MRPLTETIASSGGGKKPPPQHISGLLLPEGGSVRVNGKQQSQTSQSTSSAANSTSTTTPRRGTFSLQNGYGYPLNGFSQSSRQQSSKHARPAFYKNTMDSGNSMKEDFKVNGHHRHHGPAAGSNNMSPVLQTNQSHNRGLGLITEENLQNHQNPHKPNHIDIHFNNGCEGFLQDDEFPPREKFYVHETPSPTDSQCTSLHSGTGSADEQEEDHPFFAGMRDVRNPETLRELKIVSSKGTIRGVKNRVKAGIATFLKQGDEIKKKNYRSCEKGRIVIYTTSMMIVRDTHEKCKKVKNILQTHMVKYEERDIFMSRENQRELCQRLENEAVDVPQVFTDGLHLGGAEELEQLNESGELRRIFKHFKKISHASSCESCGGYRYIPCTVCHGSRKSVHRNHFTTEFCALRCIVCDENGLVKCDTCGDQSPDSEKTKL